MNAVRPYWRNSRQPYTDFIGGTGEEDGLSGPVDLPPGVEDDSEIQDDDGGGGGLQIAAVVAESDNFLIEQSENECKKVCFKSETRRPAVSYALFYNLYF